MFSSDLNTNLKSADNQKTFINKMINFEKKHFEEALDFSNFSKHCNAFKKEKFRNNISAVFQYISKISSDYGLESSSTLCLKLYLDKILRQKLANIKDETSAERFEHGLIISALVCLRMVMKFSEDQDRLFSPMTEQLVTEDTKRHEADFE